MKLADQVCTLLQANKLKELGIIQFSLFYHIDNMVRTIGYEGIKQRDYVKNIRDGIPVDAGVVRYYSAFTASELGVMLPDMLTTHLQYELVFIKEADDQWLGRYVRGNNMCDLHPSAPTGAGETESEVRGEMLILLLEEKIITAEECNKRLTDK
jgi:hypothetical protein